MHKKQNTWHVLHIPRWYPHRGDPMPGLFVKNHIESLPAKCESSVLFLLFVDKQRKTYDYETANINKVYTCTAYIRRASLVLPFLSNLINTFRYFRAFFKCYRSIRKAKGKPVIVHAHVLTRAGLLAWIINRWHRVPYVITEHWTRYLPGMANYHGFLRKFLTEKVVQRAGAVMPVTINLRDAMRNNNLYNQNYVVVPNVVDVNKFRPAGQIEPRSKKVLVHLSCFTDQQKNISGILRVISRLKEKRNDFVLKLIGDGEDFEKMKQLAEELNVLNSFVIFTGLKQDEALVGLLNQADLMIMFSNYENLPVVILESFACGVPVISTRVGGIHEHLKEDMGRLVEPGNEDKFLEALNDFLDNPGVYSKEKIRKYALDHFSSQVIGDSYLAVYIDVLLGAGMYKPWL
jgi:glycosyltransferase involved in cell wall biosynthesis